MSNWRTQRQFFYLFFFLLFIGLIVFGLVWYFYPTPSCVDGKQNQNEEGIDCGGLCSKACVASTLKPKVLWTRVLPVGDGRYDVVVAIENQNGDRGLENLNYKIRLYDNRGIILKTREGSTYLNPLEKAVIFESNFNVENQLATTADFTITAISSWIQAKSLPSVISIERIIEENNFSAPSSTPKLRIKVTNRSLLPLNNLIVGSLLLNENQTVYAGSKTIIERLEKGESKTVFFTWPKTLAQEPASIDFFWHLNGFEQKVLMP